MKAQKNKSKVTIWSRYPALLFLLFMACGDNNDMAVDAAKQMMSSIFKSKISCISMTLVLNAGKNVRG